MDHEPRPPRKKLHRYEVPGHARFLTCSTHRREPHFAAPQLRDAFATRLAAVQRAQPFKLFAWVLMPEHCHLLLLPQLPEAPVPRILHSLKGPLGKQFLRGRPGFGDGGERRLWQAGGGYDRNIFSAEELFEKALYIELNPVRRGLVQHPEEWAWSSAAWRAGSTASPVRVDALPR